MEGNGSFADAATAFMIFVHDGALWLVIAGFLLRAVGDALAKRRLALVRIVARFVYICSFSIFITLAAGLFLLGGVLEDGLYLAGALMCFAVAALTAFRGIRMLWPAPPPGHRNAADGTESSDDAPERSGTPSSEQ